MYKYKILESFVRKVVREEFSNNKKSLNEVQSRYYIAYYARIGEHGEAGTSPSFKSAYESAIAKSKNEDFMDGLEYVGVEGSGTNANQFGIIFITDFYLKNVISKSSFNNIDDYKKFTELAKKVIQTGNPARGSYSN